jgi:hypothetical protein
MMGWLITLGYVVGFVMCVPLFTMALLRGTLDGDTDGNTEDYILCTMLGMMTALLWPLGLLVWWVARQLKRANERQPHE